MRLGRLLPGAQPCPASPWRTRSNTTGPCTTPPMAIEPPDPGEVLAAHGTLAPGAEEDHGFTSWGPMNAPGAPPRVARSFLHALHNAAPVARLRRACGGEHRGVCGALTAGTSHPVWAGDVAPEGPFVNPQQPRRLFLCQPPYYRPHVRPRQGRPRLHLHVAGGLVGGGGRVPGRDRGAQPPRRCRRLTCLCLCPLPLAVSRVPVSRPCSGKGPESRGQRQRQRQVGATSRASGSAGSC